MHDPLDRAAVVDEHRPRQRVTEGQLAQPALMRLGPLTLPEAQPATQKEFREAVTGAHQVLARVINAAHQIAEALLLLAGHERERELPRGEESHESLRVTPIGLHPIPRRPRDRSRRDHPHVKTTPHRLARERKPGRARLIHRANRPPERLEENRHDIPGRTTQPLHPQLAAEKIKHGRDRLRPMHIKPDKAHTLRHGRHLP